MNYSGKVIATDLDGTLFYPKRRFTMICNANLKFIRHFIDNGGRLLIVSGRNRPYLNKVIAKVNRPVDIAGCNGSFIIVNNNFIKQKFMDNVLLNKTLDDIQKRFYPDGTFLMSKDYSFVVPKKEFSRFNRFGHLVYQISQGIYKERAEKSDKLLHSELKNGKIYKVMFFFGITKKEKSRCREANTMMRKLYPEFEFSWVGQAIEMTLKGCSKADAVKQYLDYLKIKHDNVMVVGDSGNDISMFRNFKNSFCMAHSSDEVSKYATYKIKKFPELKKYL